MYEILQESPYAFALRSYRGCDTVVTIEEDSQKFSESFVSYPSIDTLIDYLINDSDCETTFEEVINMYRALPDLPKLHIYKFDESSVKWEVDINFIIIGGEPHILKFQTTELQKIWKHKIWENNGSILQDFVYKIYEDEGRSFVWYFVNEEEKTRHTRNEV